MTKKQPWLLVGLVVFSALIRLWHLEAVAGFDFDQELAVTQASQILAGDLTLIGQEVSVGGIFVGPFYNYITALILLLSQGDPLGIYLFQAVLGVLSTALCYSIAESIKPKSGWLTALVYVLAWRLVYIDKTAAPSNWLPFLTLLALWVATRKKIPPHWKFWLSASVVGFASQLHPVGIVLIFIPMSILWRQPSLKQLGTLGLGLSLIVVWFSPLLLFDIRHGWLNLQGLLNRGTVVDYPFLFRGIARLRLLIDTLITTVSWNRQPLIIVGSLWIIWVAKKIWQTQRWLLAGIGVNWLIFSVYKGGVYDYYFLPAVTIFVLLLGLSLGQLLAQKTWVKAVTMIWVLVFVFNNLSIIGHHTNPYSLAVKKQILRHISTQANRPTKVHLDTDLGQANGFRYLATFFEIPITWTHDQPDFIVAIPATRVAGGQVISGVSIHTSNQ